MSTFAWIALALWVSAACSLYDRLRWPVVDLWAWLTAKALALRSWVFRDELGDVLAREAGRELQFDATETAEEWTRRHALPPAPPADRDTSVPRRRPTRSEAAKARKKGKR